MHSHLSSPSVTIVGGGLSGTLCAVHLLRSLRIRCHIRIVERTGDVGPGVAYGTKEPGHLLNVRASAMGGISGRPADFLDWMRGTRGVAESREWGVAGPDPDAFFPRGLYAAYLRDLLRQAEGGAEDGVSLEKISAEAVAVTVGRDGLGRVSLGDGRVLTSDAVVLAMGNPPPEHPTRDELPFYESPRYVRDPWSRRALEGVGAESRVLIVGSNLTMIDVVISLARMGHRGAVHAISRHGLLPAEHTAKPATNGKPSPVGARSVRDALHTLRSRLQADGGPGPRTDWRTEIDSFRWEIAPLWQGLIDAERRRFVRHVRPYWDVHRHRAAPATWRDLERARASGRWRLVAGRIQTIRESDGAVAVDVALRGKGKLESSAYDFVVNTTGPAADYRRVRDPLFAQLFREGWVRPGPLGLGLDALPDGTLRSVDGGPSPVLSTLGPPLRGVLWETTAVPEIRDQAAALAERILRSLSSD